MKSLILKVLHIPSFAVLFLFVIYYAISTLAITCLLMFSSVSVRMRHVLVASMYAGLFSAIISSLVIMSIFPYDGADRALVFAVSNIIFQYLFLWFFHGASFKSICIPLIVGNSLAYLITFSQILQLM